MTFDELPNPARHQARAILTKTPGFTVVAVTEQPAEGGRSWALYVADPGGKPPGSC